MMVGRRAREQSLVVFGLEHRFARHTKGGVGGACRLRRRRWSDVDRRQVIERQARPHHHDITIGARCAGGNQGALRGRTHQARRDHRAGCDIFCPPPHVMHPRRRCTPAGPAPRRRCADPRRRCGRTSSNPHIPYEGFAFFGEARDRAPARFRSNPDSGGPGDHRNVAAWGNRAGTQPVQGSGHRQGRNLQGLASCLPDMDLEC